ncbi:ATP-binding cassette domain-containing protein [Leucobacter japonicus]|uniref:ATP-binding cassette domain-containing protein n=1 Tax=Leucobacter japonicus TaxID=1461259 RepID=UPI00094963DF|nr:ABC transporter ATP-binding protein [Leucobacter japonicus]
MPHTDSAPTAPLRDALRPAAPLLISAVFAAAASGLVGLAGTWSAVRFIGDPRTENGLQTVLGWALAAVLAGLSAWAAHAGEARFSGRLRRTLSARLVRLPASSVARIGSERLRRAVTVDIAALHHAVAHLPSEIATLVVVPIATVVLLLAMAGPVALLALIPGVLAAVYSLGIVPRIAAKHGAAQAAVLGDIESAVGEHARGIRVNRLFGAQAGAAAEYQRATERFTDGMVAWVARVATPAAISAACLQAAVTYAVAYLVGYGRSPEVIAAMMLFGLAIVTPALRLGHGLDYVRAGKAAAARLQQIFAEPVVAAAPTCAPLGDAAIELDSVSVALDGRRVIHHLDHAAARGRVTAIVGQSGAGKSTLLRAIAGWEPIAAGEVRVARVNGDAPLLIPQGAHVLDASVRDNLTIDGQARGDDELKRALQRAQLEVALDAGAATLSGGERQRLGIARVFLAHAPVVLLDEPTSALDRDTADRVVRELIADAEERQRAIVLVTHDPLVAATAHERLELAPSEPVSAAPAAPDRATYDLAQETR